MSYPRSANPSLELSIQQISKQYSKDKWGLRDFSLDLKPGVTGLLGPNGAGKSTLMRILATITKPSAGKVLWNHMDIAKKPDALRAVMGYLPQDFGVYPNLNAIEFLEYMAAIKELDGKTARRRIDELLQLVNLQDAAKRPLGGYSGGMKQRVGIAQALLNDPQLLIVDEPTAGLDPEERVRFRGLLSDLAGERIILLSTHIVSDIEAIANQIVILNKGQMLRQATPEALLRLLERQVWQWVIPSEALPELKLRHPVSGVIRRENGMQVRVISPSMPDAQAEQVSPTLEDVYLHEIAQG